MDTEAKKAALLDLAKRRQSTRLDGYASIGDFHDGFYECDHVSPWTKSGCNVNADVMVVGQDWSDDKVLAADPPKQFVAENGFDPSFPTNRNLDKLLLKHFSLTREECYLTNLFVFIKSGNASNALSLPDMEWSAREFTLPEIRVVSPRIVLALGLRTYLALMRATDRKGSPKISEAIDNPFDHDGTRIQCVAHTGGRGMSNRGRAQVEKDWEQIAQSIEIR